MGRVVSKEIVPSTDSGRRWGGEIRYFGRIVSLNENVRRFYAISRFFSKHFLTTILCAHVTRLYATFARFRNVRFEVVYLPPPVRSFRLFSTNVLYYNVLSPVHAVTYDRETIKRCLRGFRSKNYSTTSART